MNRRNPARLLAGFALLLATGTGCTTPDERRPDLAHLAPSVSSSPTSTPAVTATASPEPEPVGPCAKVDKKVTELSGDYQLVDYSQGEKSHLELASSFAASAVKFRDYVEKNGCTTVSEPSAALAFYASILDVNVETRGKADDKSYEQTAQAGQQLLDAAGVESDFGHP